MATTYMLLKADPYNEGKNLITAEKFYDGKDAVYLIPNQSLSEALEKIAGQEGFPAGILRINGYAGCGKTLFAHYLIRRYAVKELFSYQFERGEGEDYSIDFIKSKILRKLSREIATLIEQNSTILSTFQQLGKLFDGNEKIYSCIRFCFSNENDKRRITFENTKKQYEEITDSVEKWIMSAYENETNLTVSDIVSFLLVLDYLLRIALSKNTAPNNERRNIFCLLDNIDNLNRDAVSELYRAVVNVVNMIRYQQLANEDFFGTKGCYPLIYLFPTREVTERKLLAGLQKKMPSETLDSPGILDYCRLSLDNKEHGKIVQKRIDYWSKNTGDLQLEAGQLSQLRQAKVLIRTNFAQGSFSSLYNNNYSRCINRILEFYNKYPALAKECANPPIPRGSTTPKHIKSAIAFAQRGIFLRGLLEMLKAMDAYVSPTDFHKKYHFQSSSKLGLATLTPYYETHALQVSLSRLVLTYLKSKEGNTAYLSELLDCFSDYEAQEVCRCVYALGENLRNQWRRLVMFNSSIPTEVQDLYEQAKILKKDHVEDTEIQLCVAGREYLNVVVPSFEFFLSRLDRSCNIVKYPPLFSVESMKSGKWRQSIDTVLRSVEQCAEHLYHYDIAMIDTLLERGEEATIANLFFSANVNLDGKRTQDIEQKQSHLSRLVFSHVSYIEAFRRYYLWYWSYVVTDNKKKPMELVDDNKRIISYMIRYLTLFSREWINANSKYAPLLTNPNLTLDYVATAYYLYDCRSVNAHLPKKGKSQLIDGLHDGFRRQEKAQNGLFDIILAIHLKKYSEETFFTAIEINNDEKGGHI